MNNIQASLDPHKFAFRTNRCTEDAIFSLHTPLDDTNTYISMLFVIFSSALKKIQTMKLIGL